MTHTPLLPLPVSSRRAHQSRTRVSCRNQTRRCTKGTFLPAQTVSFIVKILCILEHLLFSILSLTAEAVPQPHYIVCPCGASTGCFGFAQVPFVPSFPLCVLTSTLISIHPAVLSACATSNTMMPSSMPAQLSPSPAVVRCLSRLNRLSCAHQPWHRHLRLFRLRWLWLLGEKFKLPTTRFQVQLQEAVMPLKCRPSLDTDPQPPRH